MARCIMKNKIKLVIKIVLFFAFFGVVGHVFAAETLSAKAIVEKSDKQMRGESRYIELTMNVIRPDSTRSLSMKSWNKGKDLSLVLVTAPAEERGNASLKRDNEIWNWDPRAEKVSKIVPSKLDRFWLASDFTTNDVSNQSSIVADYDQTIIKEEVIDGDKTWVIDAIAKPDAPIMLSKVRLWISQKTFIQRKVESYDEFNKLVNTMSTNDIKEFNGRNVATRIDMIPANKSGYKTEILINKAHFDFIIDDEFFSKLQMKSLRN
ncbi:outer membrane lipoprotein-sorting protein [Aliivibrio salmonicida]|uniref:Membrane protein n=2 Tax=Aliivibrio salmonicida TaxID=40269 RepID=B6EJY9_ALISL|nr:outer membrane lipoprotein-sorting protein [Aliivibrio salmonicida]CAQ78936.1 putative membrane protein [Aliivibrio salmonicida LFI1238]